MPGWGKIVTGAIIGVAGTIYATNEEARSSVVTRASWTSRSDSVGASESPLRRRCTSRRCVPRASRSWSGVARSWRCAKSGLAA